MNNFTWTPEAIDVASRLYAAGQHSASQIAVIIGTSKGSVIGKMDRLNITSPRTKADNHPGTERKRVERKGPAKAVQVLVQPPAPVLRLVSHGKPIWTLAVDECRWPVSEDATGTHLFCAGPTERGQSYCPQCRKLAYAPPEYKPRIGHTAGRRFG